MTLRERVMAGEAAIVHGLGYIGASCAAFLRARGVAVIGIDPDDAKRVAARDGVCPVPELDSWLRAAGAPFRPMHAFDSLAFLKIAPARPHVAVHHVAVPTEAEGAASNVALYEVMEAIDNYDGGAIVVIESTVTPTYLDEIARRHPGLRIVVAPRRDWFDAADKHLGTLRRIVGCDDPVLLGEVANYIGLVCDRVVCVHGAREAALVKVVENGVRQVELAYANELALLLGDTYDVREVFALCATKWNIGLFRPSIGIGGYCLPLAPQYLQDAARAKAQTLPITETAVRVARAHIDFVAAYLTRFKSVHFWTVSYKALAPFTLSAPAIWIAQAIRRVSRVGVFPRDAREAAWAQSIGADVLTWPDDAGGDALVIPVAHAEARALTDTTARETVGRYRLVLDNEDALAHISPAVWTAEIRVPGRKGWLS